MANQLKKTSASPEQLFIVESIERATYWIYSKEGHAINRKLEQDRIGNQCQIVVYERCEDKA